MAKSFPSVVASVVASVVLKLRALLTQSAAMGVKEFHTTSVTMAKHEPLVNIVLIGIKVLFNMNCRNAFYTLRQLSADTIIANIKLTVVNVINAVMTKIIPRVIVATIECHTRRI